MLRLKDASGVKRDLVELAVAARELAERSRVAARPDRNAAVAGVDARRRGPVDLRQLRLCARGRSQERSRRRRRAASSCSTARRATTFCARSPPTAPMPAGCRPSSPARGAPSMCSISAPRPAAPASGIDATEAETMRVALARMVDAHRRTLDQLSTGVAMFGADHRLTFYNAAYRALWDLDRRLSRPGPDRLGGARGAARRAQAAGRAGFPAMEGAAVTRPTARSRPRNTCGTCPTAAPCASSPRPILTAASPTCSTTSPSGSTSTGASRS